MFPILNPRPTSLPIQSLWVLPVHQPQASCIQHRTWTGDSFLIWYYTCFNSPKSFPPPSPTESKRLFYTSVSLLLSRIEGYRYHLSKFHIYALVYWIGVFLSGYGMLGADALGWPRGMVWVGRWEGCSGLGTCVHPWRIHVDVWQNQYNIVIRDRKSVV